MTYIPWSEFWPVNVHRNLEPDALRARAAQRHRARQAQQPEDRRLSDAMVAGALQGAALSRRTFGGLATPVERLFGTDLLHRPVAAHGLIPYTFQAAKTLVDAALVPRLAPWAQRGAQRLVELFGRQSAALGALSETERRAAFEFVGAISAYIATQSFAAPAHLAVTCGFYVTAAAKGGTALPGATLGALFGACQHVATKWNRADALHSLGARGARNEETFAHMAPVAEIPQGYFFLSEDRFGFDVRELFFWLQIAGGRINPHTNVPFCADDIARLAAHGSGLLAELGAGSNATAHFSLVGWHKYHVFFHQLARALRLRGPQGEELRNRAADAIVQVVNHPEPFERLALRQYFEFVGGRRVAEVVATLRSDAGYAFQVGSFLKFISQSIGWLATLQVTVAFAGSDTTATSGEREAAKISAARAHLANTMLLFQDGDLESFPWVKSFYTPTPGFGDVASLGEIDLTVPVEQTPAQRWIVAEAERAVNAHPPAL